MSIFLILLAGLLIRLIALNQSLWLDEAVTANVSRFSYHQILSSFSPHDFHPPLYYFFLKFWTDLFGNSPVSIRLPSVFFSILAAYFVFLIGRNLKNRSLGVWSAAFFIFNPLIVYYSQEARMYLPAACFLTISVYAFIKILSSPKIIYIILFNFCIGLSFLTFYGSIFLIAAFFLYLLLARQFKVFFSLTPGFLVALILVAPLLLQQYIHSKEQLGLVVNWKTVLGSANLKNLILIPLKFSFGRISFYPKIAYFLLSGLWSLVIFAFAFKGLIKSSKLLFLFICPLILAFIFSLFSPLFQYFRFLYLLPVLSIGLALGLNRLLIKSIFATIFFSLSLLYLVNPTFHREDWQSLSKSLPSNSTVYMIPSFSDPIKYYRPDISILDIRNLPSNISSLHVIPYGEYIHGFDHTAFLSAVGFKQQKTTTFNQIYSEVWQR